MREIRDAPPDDDDGRNAQLSSFVGAWFTVVQLVVLLLLCGWLVGWLPTLRSVSSSHLLLLLLLLLSDSNSTCVLTDSNPNYGYTSFDNFGIASYQNWEMIIQV